MYCREAAASGLKTEGEELIFITRIESRTNIHTYVVLAETEFCIYCPHSQPRFHYTFNIELIMVL
jgi:hypothetical protein